MTQDNFEQLQIHQERIKVLQKKTKDLEEKLLNLETCIRILENKNFDKLNDTIHDLEMKVKSVEIAQGGHDQNWKAIANFAVQIIWVIMAAYILFKLGLQPPI